MGNRDDLLRGALESLLERGYAATTARDVTARAGTSLAAIGYHFGSTERLLHEAIGEGFRLWRARLAEVVEEHAGASAGELIAALGDELARLFVDERALFAVFLEALALADRSEDVRARAAAGYHEDREGIAALVRSVRRRSRGDEDVVAAALLAVVDGLFIQHLVDPDGAPSPKDVLGVLAPAIVPARGRPRAAARG